MSGLIADSRTMVDKARVEAQVKPEYSHTNSQDWFPYISLKNYLREIVLRSKHPPFDDHFINSHKFFS